MINAKEKQNKHQNKQYIKILNCLNIGIKNF